MALATLKLLAVARSVTGIQVEDKSGWTKLTGSRDGFKLYVPKSPSSSTVRISGFRVSHLDVTEVPEDKRETKMVTQHIDLNASDEATNLRLFYRLLADCLMGKEGTALDKTRKGGKKATVQPTNEELEAAIKLAMGGDEPAVEESTEETEPAVVVAADES